MRQGDRSVRRSDGRRRAVRRLLVGTVTTVGVVGSALTLPQPASAEGTAPTVSVVAGDDSLTYGETTDLTVTVTTQGSDTLDPTGVVDFYACGDTTTPASCDAATTGAVLIGTESLADDGTGDGSATVTLGSWAPGAGAYLVAAVYDGDEVYSTSSGTVAVSVVPRSMTVTADDDSVAYGDAAPSPLTFQITDGSFLDGDDWVSEPTCEADYTAGDGVGTYDIDCVVDAGPNYDVTTVPGTLTVSERSIVVGLDPATDTVTYGEAASLLPTITEGAFLAADPGWLTAPTCESAYAAGDSVGTYDVTCSGGDAGPNYDVTYEPGTLTVEARTLQVTAEDKEMTYGGEVPAYSFLVGGDGFYGTDTWISEPTCDSGYDATAAGDIDITCQLGNAGGNYTVSYLPGTLTVKPFELSPADPWYTGQNFFYTRSSSDTATQVTLTASITADIDGDSVTSEDAESCGEATVAGGRVRFVDKTSGKVVADNVRIAPVGDNCEEGIATAFATLSAGSAFVDSYLVVVEVYGALAGTTDRSGGQIATDPTTATVTVSVPAVQTSGLFGYGELAYKANVSSTDLGTEGTRTTAMQSGDVAEVAFGFTYGRKGVTPKGRVVLTIPGPDGSVYLIKSSSITSTSVPSATTATVYAKGNVAQIPLGCTSSDCHVALEGNVSFRLDMTELAATTGGLTPGKVAVTVQSAKTSDLLFSNHWFKSGKAWGSLQQDLYGPACYVSVS